MIRATTPALGFFFPCLFVGPFNPILATFSLSLTGCRVVFSCFCWSVWLDLQRSPKLAGGSSPTPASNWIIIAIPRQLFVYWSVGDFLGGCLFKTEKGCLLLLFFYTLGVSHM